MMKVLVIGSGGREHALVWKIAQSPMVRKIYCAPGNPGISKFAENVAFKASDLDGLLKFAKENKIDLTVVGPEDPLVFGIVDKFSRAGLKIFGPNKRAAQLEGSKSFAKQLMKKYQRPTADYEIFTSADQAKSYIEQVRSFPVVLKADGLAAGKGVLICQNKREAVEGISILMERRIFGEAGEQIVVEEFLAGEEVSIFILSDGENYRLLASSQDHKKVFDGDRGKNTGGMGAYAPAPIADKTFIKTIETTIIKPTFQAMQNERAPYRGLLYIGVIVTPQGPKVLEYNCRFGDPETEVVLPLLESDLIPLLLASAEGNLENHKIDIKQGYAFDVVLASGGYPDAYEKGKVITGLEHLDDRILVFHAGTSFSDNNLLTSGGRVLNIVAIGNTFESVRDLVYQNINKIKFDRMHYRTDIGFRAFKHLEEG
jgi:phosphoribosylamine--glycine ligase